MQFDTKIAVIIRNDLETWQKLNVAAFTVSGIASIEGIIGEKYVDGSDRTYLPMIKQPILILVLITSRYARCMITRSQRMRS